MMPASYKTFKIFKPFKELNCIFSTRTGGVSENEFAANNMGLFTGDKIEHVKTNRMRFFKSVEIPPEKIAFMNQVHSGKATFVSEPGIYPETDALITTSQGLFLAVQTADCFPVFISAPSRNIVAVIHAGWRGAAKNIISNTLNILKHQFNLLPDQIFVAIGPGLQQECFEVQKDVYRQFPERYFSNDIVEGKWHFNLRQFIMDQLTEFGIHNSQIQIDETCTKCNNDLYYSYRRDNLKSGRMLGIIGIKS